MELFLLMGQRYVGDDALGRQCHGMRKNLDLNLSTEPLREIKRRLYQTFAEVGVGREAGVIARRR